ncbi:hypothetical protein K7432_007940 [Basidiobolus ranarum]|uniref:Uncharacterized protein n=1 Tax=Basidiobolus ranarum TaxID=34480 RepID=A0ABR2VZS2_9FUNG
MRSISLLGVLGVLLTLNYSVRAQQYDLNGENMSDTGVEGILQSVLEDSFQDATYNKDYVLSHPVISHVEAPGYDQVIITQFKSPRNRIPSLNRVPWSNNRYTNQYYGGDGRVSIPDYQYLDSSAPYQRPLRSRNFNFGNTYSSNDFNGGLPEQSFSRPHLFKRSLPARSKPKSFSRKFRRAATKPCPNGHLDHDGNCVNTACPYRDADGECSTKKPVPCNKIDDKGNCSSNKRQ